MHRFFLVAVVALAACATTPRSPTMSNQQIVRSLYEDVINPGRLERMPELVADDYVGANGERGPAGFTSTVAGLRAAFPDIHFTVEDLVGDGDRVAVRWVWHATHAGPFRGIAATGKPVTNTAIAIYQLAGGKIVRAWLESDRLGALQQIGAVPALPAPPPGR